MRQRIARVGIGPGLGVGIALCLGLALAVPERAAAGTGALPGGCTIRSGPERTRLVELYTSEGCSSCPPADRWLSGLLAHGGAGVAALAFHVDYWDHLGWRDRFGDAAYSRRQRERVAAEGGRVVYTPQVMVDGRSWLAWRGRDAGALPPNPARPGADIEIALDGDVEVTARLTDRRLAASARLYVARVEHGLASEVTAGENRGERLAHDAVVRHLADAVAFDAEGIARTRLPATLPGVDATRASWTAFVQRPDDGTVLQALRLDAGDCRKAAISSSSVSRKIVSR